MSDLSSETRDVLKLARSAKLLSDEQRSSHKAALYARLGMGAALVTTKAAASGMGWFATIGTTKLIVGTALLVGGGIAGYAAFNANNEDDNVPALTLTATAAPAAAATTVTQPVPAPQATNDVQPEPEKRPAPRTRTTGRPEVARTDTNSLIEETRLIREADRALRAGDARRAVTLLDEHAARFPNGTLAPERNAERLLASCVLGTASPAAVEAFIRRNPGSALTARLKQACSTAKR